MSLIILRHPADCQCPACTAEREQDAIDARLQQRYDSDPAFARLADSIHDSRMGCGPACPQCMAIAERRLSTSA